MSVRPRLLDLFCGAGGCSMGYHRAGFDVTGVDIKPQPRYPFIFIQGDALEYLREHGHEYDAITASPPCQAFSAMRKGRWQDREHPDLIEPTRATLKATGKPYVIENVEGAPLMAPITLCGTMFGLRTRHGSQLRRHRLFEAPWFFGLIPTCAHNEYAAIGVYGGGQHPQRRCNDANSRLPATIGVYVNSGGSSVRDGTTGFGVVDRRDAMGIDWMTNAELSQAIPPAYTQFIGEQLLAEVTL